MLAKTLIWTTVMLSGTPAKSVLKTSGLIDGMNSDGLRERAAADARWRQSRALNARLAASVQAWPTLRGSENATV